MKSKFVWIVLIVLFGNCSDHESYPTPVITSPAEGQVFYPSQLVALIWQVPDSTKTTEVQFAASLESSLLTAGDLPFQGRPSSLSTFLTNQSSYRSTFDATLTQTMYNGFRVRYVGPHGTSGWSAIRHYVTSPLSSLNVKTIEFTFTFDFDAHDTNNYYSDVTVSHETLNLNQALINAGVNLGNIEFVRLDSGFMKDTGGYASHIERIDVGFSESPDGTYPVNSIATAGAIMYQPNIQFNASRDLYRELSGKLLPMKAVYFIDHFRDAELPVGKNHHVEVFLRLKSYSR